MNRKIIEQQKHLARENKQWPNHLVQILPQDWTATPPIGTQALFRSNRFLVAVIEENHNIRITVNRTMVNSEGCLLYTSDAADE